jgi:hypothetical protein
LTVEGDTFCEDRGLNALPLIEGRFDPTPSNVRD